MRFKHSPPGLILAICVLIYGCAGMEVAKLREATSSEIALLNDENFCTSVNRIAENIAFSGQKNIPVVWMKEAKKRDLMFCIEQGFESGRARRAIIWSD